MHWLMQTLIALDQLINAALCGGWADETMSSYAWRMEQESKPWGFMRRVIDWLASPIQSDHCHKAYESAKQRLHLPPEMR